MFIANLEYTSDNLTSKIAYTVYAFMLG